MKDVTLMTSPLEQHSGWDKLMERRRLSHINRMPSQLKRFLTKIMLDTKFCMGI